METFEEISIDMLRDAVPGEDVAVNVPPYEVEFGDPGNWVLVERKIFRSWTGRRRFSGVEVHGPIYSVQDKDDKIPFTGRRSCSCLRCQEFVEPQFKPN